MICSQEDVFQSFESGATPKATTQRGMRILNGLFGITMVLFSIIGLGFAVEALVLVSFKYSGIVSKHWTVPILWNPWNMTFI